LGAVTKKKTRYLGRRGVGADEGTKVVVVLSQYKMADTSQYEPTIKTQTTS